MEGRLANKLLKRWLLRCGSNLSFLLVEKTLVHFGAAHIPDARELREGGLAVLDLGFC